MTLLTAAVALLIATTLFNITYNSSTITYCSNITYNAATLLTAGIASHIYCSNIIYNTAASLTAAVTSLIAAILLITQQHYLRQQ